MDNSAALILMLLLAVGWYAFWAWRRRGRRGQPPPAFIGRFQRPDGSQVNVLRLTGGRLIAMSPATGGEKGAYLGTVNRATLNAWRLVSTQASGTPDASPPLGRRGGRRARPA